MNKIQLSSLWTTAAWREAARVRAPEVDVDHLYLGLIAVGGAAAALLGRHGISLASARARAREAMASDLSTLGIDIADLPSPIHLLQMGDPAWKATPRADALLHEARMTDTYEMLVTLMKEPSGTIRRLVAADGVTPQDLVPELKQGADDPYAPDRAKADDRLLPRPHRALRISRFVSAPPALVADALADPALLGLWAYDPTRVQASDGGLTVRHEKGGRTLTTRMAVERDSTGEDASVLWTTEALDTRHAGQRLVYDLFTITPAPGGAVVTRTSGRRSFGVLGRALAPVHDLLGSWGLVHTMQAITFGIADRQPT